MALSAVELSTDVFLVCMAHALTTEKEEVMGLLLGDVEVRIPFFFSGNTTQ
jgi:BRCA1/BRCA2-containing complex subunit 3